MNTTSSKFTKSNCTYTTALILSSVLTMLSVPAVAEQSIYIGGAYGQSRINDSDFDDDSSAIKIFAGGKFNNYIGIEAAANDYGDASGSGYKSELGGVTLAVVGYLPLGENFEVFIKGGNLWWEAKVEVVGIYNDTLSGNELFFGAGANFNLNETLTFRVEYERYDVDLSKEGSWGFSVLKRHNPLQPPWLLASSGVLTSS